MPRLALHQHGPTALRALAFVHDAEALGDFGVGLEQAAEVAAEAVLVELLVRLDVPEPAGVGRNLIRHHDPHQLDLPQPPGLHLEVDETDADAEEHARQKVVDADRERHDVVDLLRRRPAEGGDVLLRYHWIVELIVLVIELDDRARQLRTLFDAEALGQRAGRDVAHDHRQRNDLDLADQLLAHVEAADEMRRHADVVEVLKHVFRNPVVEDPLALDHLMLLRIEGGRVILEVLDQSSRLGPLIEDLGLAFIDAATAVHRRVPWFVNVHAMPWVPEVWLSCPRLEGTRATRPKEREHASASLTANLAHRGGQHNQRHRSDFRTLDSRRGRRQRCTPQPFDSLTIRALTRGKFCRTLDVA